MIKASDYRPSRQVSLIVDMINDSGAREDSWDDALSRGFKRGTRNGMNLILRALVALETEIDDPDLVDDVCADLITEALINKC